MQETIDAIKSCDEELKGGWGLIHKLISEDTSDEMKKRLFSNIRKQYGKESQASITNGGDSPRRSGIKKGVMFGKNIRAYKMNPKNGKST